MPLQNLLKQRDDLNLTDWRDDSVIEKWKSEFNWSYESCRNDLYSSDSQYWVIILVLSTVASYGLLQNIFLVSNLVYNLEIYSFSEFFLLACLIVKGQSY